MTQTQTELENTLQQRTMKPYWKLTRLICAAHAAGLITEEQGDAFDEELNLLVKGLNRSHNTIPRSFIND